MTIQLPLSQVEMSMKTDICNKDTVCLILSIPEQYSGHTVSRVFFFTIIVGVKKKNNRKMSRNHSIHCTLHAETRNQRVLK